MKKHLMILALALFSLPVFAQQNEKDQKPQLFPILLDGKWGFANTAGRAVISPRFEDVDVKNGFYNGLIGVKQGGKWGYMNAKGEIVIQPQFSGVGPFIEDMAKIREADSKADKGKIGYINKKGKTVVNPEYDIAFPAENNFSEGLCLVTKSNKSGYIDKKGNIVIPIQYSTASAFSDGLAAVKQGDSSLFGFIDTKGQWVINPQFKAVTHCANGIIGFTKDERLWAFMDKRGRVLTDTVYQLDGMNWNISEGLGKVAVNKKYGFIDNTGKLVIFTDYEMANDFSEGMAAVKKESWGFVDKSGKLVIQPKFEEVGHFSEGMAPAREKGKWGFIDKKGNWVIEPKFEDMPGDFMNGLSRVTVKSGKAANAPKMIGYIGKDGRYAWDPQM